MRAVRGNGPINIKIWNWPAGFLQWRSAQRYAPAGCPNIQPLSGGIVMRLLGGGDTSWPRQLNTVANLDRRELSGRGGGRDVSRV